jgi:hypothetical protein
MKGCPRRQQAGTPSLMKLMCDRLNSPMDLSDDSGTADQGYSWVLRLTMALAKRVRMVTSCCRHRRLNFDDADDEMI